MFKRLHDDGLIYRAERIINWCPRDLTALSDIEVEHVEDDDGELVSDPVRGRCRLRSSWRPPGSRPCSATQQWRSTRTMQRYQHLVGREIELPLVGRMIKVVADEHVDPTFGTGAVKVTPAHDPNDFEIGQSARPAEMINVMNDDAAINLPGPWLGMDRFEARSAITEELRLPRPDRRARSVPYVHSVGHCSRCGTTVEPRLSLQWFVNVAPTRQGRPGDAVRNGTVTHPPGRPRRPRWFAWVDNMHDWCISRQLWWGHRIPVWYGPEGETVVVGPDDEIPTGEGWHQDEDVLDTWFSSGLWPFSTLGWPERDPRPREVLSDHRPGHRLRHLVLLGRPDDDVRPLRDAGRTPRAPSRSTPLPCTAWCATPAARRCPSRSATWSTRSSGWIKYGADALRFTLARGANPGTDVPISEDWVQGSAQLHHQAVERDPVRADAGRHHGRVARCLTELSAADRWILSRLAAVEAEADELYDNYEFAKACDLLFHFAWDEVFDWYVELVKAPLEAGGRRRPTPPAACSARCSTALLRLLHPVMPFLTEHALDDADRWRVGRGGADWPVRRPVGAQRSAGRAARSPCSSP